MQPWPSQWPDQWRPSSAAGVLGQRPQTSAPQAYNAINVLCSITQFLQRALAHTSALDANSTVGSIIPHVHFQCHVLPASAEPRLVHGQSCNCTHVHRPWYSFLSSHPNSKIWFCDFYLQSKLNENELNTASLAT